MEGQGADEKGAQGESPRANAATHRACCCPASDDTLTGFPNLRQALRHGFGKPANGRWFGRLT